MPEDPKICPDCGAKPGEQHLGSCHVARCMETGLQQLKCTIFGSQHDDCGKDIWTGLWPGEAECREFGWFAVYIPDSGWQSCPPDAPDALPHLKRLRSEATWDRESHRWVR